MAKARFMATISEELRIDRHTILVGGFNPGLEKMSQEARNADGHPLQNKKTIMSFFVAAASSRRRYEIPGCASKHKARGFRHGLCNELTAVMWRHHRLRNVHLQIGDGDFVILFDAYGAFDDLFPIARPPRCPTRSRWFPFRAGN